jgi:hypothetical protein
MLTAMSKPIARGIRPLSSPQVLLQAQVQFKDKSKKDKGQFEKAVHKAMLEYTMADSDGSDEEEGDLYANIAGDGSSVDEEPKSDSEGDDSDAYEDTSALVACALKNLVKD